MEVKSFEQVPGAVQYLIKQVNRLEGIIEKLVENSNNLPAPKGDDLPDKLYTRQETAAMLKISLVTLNEWTNSGYISSQKIGTRRVYYKKADVEKALKKQNKLFN